MDANSAAWHLDHGKIAGSADLSRTPDWAKPIVAAALKLRSISGLGKAL